MKKGLTVILALALILCAATAGAVTLKLSEVHAEGYPTTLADHEFARLVEERTEGRVKIDAGTVPAITLKLRPGADPVDEADAFIRAYNDAATQK